jgi:hypothetical protein
MTLKPAILRRFKPGCRYLLLKNVLTKIDTVLCANRAYMKGMWDAQNEVAL